MMKKPAHPGSVTRVGVLEPLDLSINKAASILGVRRATLSDLINGKSSLTPEMAIRIEKAFGQDMEHLMRTRHQYDVAEARAQAKKIKVKRYETA